MLKFVLEYKEAVKRMMMEKELRRYKLDEKEWEVIAQLTEILKVRCIFICLQCRAYRLQGLQARNALLLPLYPLAIQEDPQPLL